MSQLKSYCIAIILAVFCLEGCNAQSSKQSQALQLITSVALPGVAGRIDHLAFDSATGHIFIAALGNNSVEVVDLRTNKIIHSITGLSEPQGIAFITGKNMLFVANGGNGACAIFNTATYQKITSVQLPGDADNVRYDAVNKKIYVGYGEGGIAVIDVATLRQVADIKLQGHPESFQLDIAAKKIYVNVPGKQQVEVIGLEKQVVTDRWKLTAAKSNFPMALDVISRRLFIGCRHPAKLLVLDTDSGKLITAFDTDSDVDDIFYNPKNSSIYFSCGGGYIDIFKQETPNTYTLVEKIPSRSGARTSLFLPQSNRLIVAKPKSFNSDAALLVYGIKN
ncbi:YncE family protein [Ferruginibacter paludis]|uniref:YncE family protein n=1 Tax=Ferruginibacter paludis TaxID=1310417 RepID=UPI0025B28BE9|nr:YncE family protein [Ferruginibacter paludis]MDN3657433.1 YncE family protein [Ferruginibacter paludis]